MTDALIDPLFEDLPGATGELKRALGTAVDRLIDPDDLHALLARALGSVSQDLPRWQIVSLDLEPGVSEYPAPSGTRRISRMLWGDTDHTPQWSADYVGRAPRVLLQRDRDAPVIELVPAPSVRQIIRWGTKCSLRVGLAHTLDETTSTLNDQQSEALLLRAQALAMQRLANSGVTQPIQRHQGMGSSLPANAAPAALAKALMDRYWEVVRGDR